MPIEVGGSKRSLRGCLLPKLLEALPAVATSSDQEFWSAANDASYAGRLGIKGLVNVGGLA